MKEKFYIAFYPIGLAYIVDVHPYKNVLLPQKNCQVRRGSAKNGGPFVLTETLLCCAIFYNVSGACYRG